jgi:hypothetical protein
LSGTQASNLVGPPAGKQDVGYTTGGDIPTSGGLNWLFRWIYKWCQYVAGLTGEALTWTARQTFSGGATVVDPPVNPTDAASMGYVDAESTARAAADTAESTARAAADTAEAAARAAADTAEAAARAAADTAEAAARAAADTAESTARADDDATTLTAAETYADNGATAPASVPFASFWSHTDGANYPAMYSRNRSREVRLQGGAKSGNGSNSIIGTLPVGFRPPGTRVFLIRMTADPFWTYAQVQSDGDILVGVVTNQVSFYLDPISFIAEG